jgi:hypothetical protein
MDRRKMKTFYMALLMFAATTALVAVPAAEEKKSVLPRLTQIDAFPESSRDAVLAVIAALTAEGTKASEFFAVVSPGKEGLIEVSLKHQRHPDDSRWLGDECKRCRTAFYDPKSGKVLRFQFVR